VRLDDGSEFDAAWVVGADGAHSVARKAMGIGFPGVPIVERFLLADVHADIDRPREGAVSWLRGDMVLAAFPLPGDDLWRVMAPAPTDFGDEPAPDAIVDYLGSRLAAEAAGKIRSTVWTSMFRIHRRLADTYRSGCVLLAGDAAHIHSPLGGQGMNTGIGDAENLAWKLALVIFGRADQSLLDTYEAERRPVAKGVLETTSTITEVVVSQGWAARLLRDRIAVPLMNREWVQRRITDKASQLQVSYRHGPLGAQRLRHLPGLRAGDRVPDRECIGAEGLPMRLYDALGPAWALIGSDSLSEVARRRLGDVVTLSGDRDTQLVRPDGHLAWRGTDAARLQAWLDNALGSRIGALTR
jgi:4,5-epoxidase